MKTVLVIDDELTYIKLLTKYLEKTYKVISAYNGKDGLNSIKENKPDLVLLDIKLPEMDGLEVLKNLRNDPTTKGTKVIMLSSIDLNSDLSQKLKALSPLTYLQKNKTSSDQLLQTIKKFI